MSYIVAFRQAGRIGPCPVLIGWWQDRLVVTPRFRGTEWLIRAYSVWLRMFGRSGCIQISVTGDMDPPVLRVIRST